VSIPSEWLANTQPSLKISDQSVLIKNFEQINKRIINIGGGVIYCNHNGIVDVLCKDGSKMTLANVLYIPDLGVNLLYGSRVWTAGLTGQFSKSHMYFKCSKNKIILPIIHDRMYLITHIKHTYQDKLFYIVGYHEIAFSGEIINGTKQKTNKLTAAEKENYLLWHQYFNHLGPDKIRNLHKVTNLSSLIKVLTKLNMCEVWILTKMTHQTLKQLCINKSKRLELINLDLRTPFPKSICGNLYFILIIDRYSRVN
jgi:hypothetical protein